MASKKFNVQNIILLAPNSLLPVVYDTRIFSWFLNLYNKDKQLIAENLSLRNLLFDRIPAQFHINEEMEYVKEPGKQRCLSLEVPFLSTTQTRYLLPDRLDLRNQRFQNIIYIPISGSTTPEGYTGVNASEGSIYVTLVKNQYAFFSRVPLNVFNQFYQYDSLRLQNISFDMEQSYLECFDKPNLQAGQAVYFNLLLDDN